MENKKLNNKEHKPVSNLNKLALLAIPLLTMACSVEKDISNIAFFMGAGISFLAGRQEGDLGKNLKQSFGITAIGTLALVFLQPIDPTLSHLVGFTFIGAAAGNALGGLFPAPRER